MTSHIPFFSIYRYEPTAQWLRRVKVSWATWVRFPQGDKTLCCPLAILRGTEPVSALTRTLMGSATCAGLAHGRDYSYCILHDSLRAEVSEKVWPLFSLELYLKNKSPCGGILDPHSSLSLPHRMATQLQRDQFNRNRAYVAGGTTTKYNHQVTRSYRFV